MAPSRSRKDHVTRASGQNGRAHEINKAFAKNKHRGSGMGSHPFTPDHAFHFAIFKCSLLSILTSSVLSRIGDEAEVRENGFHKIIFNCGEHDILMTPGIIFDKPAYHVHLLLKTRNCLGKKSTLAFGNRPSSPPKLYFGVCFLLILLSGQVELNPGPSSPGNQNSSIFPCGYCDLPVTWDQCEICCDSCDLWFHKNCVDIGSHTFRAFSTTNVSWICCNCDNPNYELNLFHSFQKETANSFHSLNLSESKEIKSPISDFQPVLHSSAIIDHRHSKKIKNWRTLNLNCQSLRGKVEAFQSSVDYFKPYCILGTESWLDKRVSTNTIFPPGYKIFRREIITSIQGGGMFIAVKENNDVSLLPDTVTDTKLLWAKVHFEKSKSLILGSFYQPSGSKI